MKNKLLVILAAAALASLPLCAQDNSSSQSSTTTTTTTQDNSAVNDTNQRTRDAAQDAGSKTKQAAKDVGNDTKQAASDVKNDAKADNDQTRTGDKSEDRAKVMKRLDDSVADLNRLTSGGDQGVPETVLTKAKCVAIVPTLVKGGFVFGAQHGRGVATCRNNGRWSSPAFFTITGGSWGAQIGGEAVDLVMFFMTDEGAKKLLDANWKIGADAGIAAGPWGREGSANSDVKFNTAILTYSKAKGLFAGATLNGANIHQDVDATRAFYGRQVGFRDVLSGKIPPPPQARTFLAGIRREFREAQASQ